jgi:hypothetical protein
MWQWSDVTLVWQVLRLLFSIFVSFLSASLMNSKRSETLNPIAQSLTVAPQIQLEAATLDVLILPFYMDPISTLITWVCTGFVHE